MSIDLSSSHGSHNSEYYDDSSSDDEIIIDQQEIERVNALPFKPRPAVFEKKPRNVGFVPKPNTKPVLKPNTNTKPVLKNDTKPVLKNDAKTRPWPIAVHVPGDSHKKIRIGNYYRTKVLDVLNNLFKGKMKLTRSSFMFLYQTQIRYQDFCSILESIKNEIMQQAHSDVALDDVTQLHDFNYNDGIRDYSVIHEKTNRKQDITGGAVVLKTVRFFYVQSALNFALDNQTSEVSTSEQSESSQQVYNFEEILNDHIAKVLSIQDPRYLSTILNDRRNSHLKKFGIKQGDDIHLPKRNGKPFAVREVLYWIQPTKKTKLKIIARNVSAFLNGVLSEEKLIEYNGGKPNLTISSPPVLYLTENKPLNTCYKNPNEFLCEDEFISQYILLCIASTFAKQNQLPKSKSRSHTNELLRGVSDYSINFVNVYDLVSCVRSNTLRTNYIFTESVESLYSHSNNLFLTGNMQNFDVLLLQTLFGLLVLQNIEFQHGKLSFETLAVQKIPKKKFLYTIDNHLSPICHTLLSTSTFLESIENVDEITLGLPQDHEQYPTTYFTFNYKKNRARKMFCKKINIKNIDSIERAKYSCLVLSVLSHPNIVRYYEVYEPHGDSANQEDEYMYVVMPAYGISLSEYMANNGVYEPVDEESSWSILSGILDAIGYMHSRGVVHRGINVRNILVYYDEHDMPFPVLTGFGDALFLDCGETLGYSKCSEVDMCKIDLLCFGICMYTLLEGKFPYDLTNNFAEQTPVFKYSSDPAKELLEKLLVFNPEVIPTIPELKKSHWFGIHESNNDFYDTGVHEKRSNHIKIYFETEYIVKLCNFGHAVCHTSPIIGNPKTYTEIEYYQNYDVLCVLYDFWLHVKRHRTFQLSSTEQQKYFGSSFCYDVLLFCFEVDNYEDLEMIIENFYIDGRPDIDMLTAYPYATSESILKNERLLTKYFSMKNDGGDYILAGYVYDKD